jgi:hypothetical protein
MTTDEQIAGSVFLDIITDKYIPKKCLLRLEANDDGLDIDCDGKGEDIVAIMYMYAIRNLDFATCIDGVKNLLDIARLTKDMVDLEM